ncbi:g10994 [Coccomyxa elongata]
MGKRLPAPGGMQLMSSPVGVWTMHHIQRCWSWPTWRWLTGACILGLIISAVVVREADRGHVHHLTRGFFSLVPTRRSEQDHPEVISEARRGRTPAEGEVWMQMHRDYVMEIEAHAAKGLDCVFYGDSITESLRGTQMGVKIEKFVGIPEVFEKHYGHLRAAAYSIAGDTTRNLLWRLQNGEGPKKISPKVAVVLIGTNDITNPVYNLDINDPLQTSAIVASAIFASVSIMLKECARMHVILLAVMPRGERFLFVAINEKYKLPSRYSPVIGAINARLKHFAEEQERVSFVDCNNELVEASQDGEGEMLNKDLMPDALHPNARGMEKVLSCLDPHLLPYLPRSPML